MDTQITSALIGAGTAFVLGGIGFYGWLRSRLARGDQRFDQLEEDMGDLKDTHTRELDQARQFREECLQRLTKLESDCGNLVANQTRMEGKIDGMPGQIANLLRASDQGAN